MADLKEVLDVLKQLTELLHTWRKDEVTRDPSLCGQIKRLEDKLLLATKKMEAL